MQLRYAPTSPFVRKVLITALETGTSNLFETISTGPFDPETDLGQTNPLCKVPALVLDSGEALFDSPVICEYLDSLHQGRKIFPVSGMPRFMALRLQAVGDGIMDAAVLRRLEAARPQPQQSADWLERQHRAIQRSLDDLNRHLEDLQGDPDIGSITVACALGYLDFRFADDPWRPGRDALSDWFSAWSQRSCMTETHPPQGG